MKFSAFSYQYDLQNCSSPLHLSVLHHLSVIFSHLILHCCLSLRYFAYKLNYRNNRQKYYSFVINKHCWSHTLKLEISKITSGVELISFSCKTVTEIISGTGNLLKFETKYLRIAPSKRLFVHFKITIFFLQPKRSRFSSRLLINGISQNW